jgi:outer membrane protein assembly factor BamB
MFLTNLLFILSVPSRILLLGVSVIWLKEIAKPYLSCLFRHTLALLSVCSNILYEVMYMSLFFSVRVRAIGLSLLVVFVLMIGVHPSAHAASPGMASPARIALSQPYVPPGTSLKVTGKHFGATETVIISVDRTVVGTAITKTKGAFSATITVPATLFPGVYLVQAVGESSGFSAVASLQIQTDWATNGFSAQLTGYNPYENVLSPSNASHLAKKWSFYSQFNETLPAAPAVVNGVIYDCSIDGNLFTINAQTGNELWSLKLGCGPNTPTVVGGVVFIAAGNSMYAINAQTGVTLWSFIAGGFFTTDFSPTVVNGIVYFASYQALYAFNAQNGTVLWTSTMAAGSSGSPAVASGVVYIATEGYGGYLYALNAKTGAPLWSYSPSNTHGFSTSATVSGGVVYIGSDDNDLYAVNAQTGTELWSYTTGGIIDTSPAVANGVVYFGSRDLNLYALNAQSGAKIWSFGTASGVSAEPTIANGVTYVTGSSNVFAFNALTGAELWRFPNTYLISEPVVVNGQLLVGTSDIALYDFSLPGMNTSLSPRLIHAG